MTPMYATTISGVDENDRRFSHLDFLLRHLLTVVFVAFLIEGAGLPLPSRLLLLVAATLATDVQQRVWLVAASAPKRRKYPTVFSTRSEEPSVMRQYSARIRGPVREPAGYGT